MKGWTIYDLLDNGWSIASSCLNKGSYFNLPDLTYRLIKKYKQGKGKRQFKKIISKYNNYEN